MYTDSSATDDGRNQRNATSGYLNLSSIESTSTYAMIQLISRQNMMVSKFNADLRSDISYRHRLWVALPCGKIKVEVIRRPEASQSFRCRVRSELIRLTWVEILDDDRYVNLQLGLFTGPCFLYTVFRLLHDYTKITKRHTKLR